MYRTDTAIPRPSGTPAAEASFGFRRSGESLLALRRAAWPFREALVRSQRYDAMLVELCDIDRELAGIRKSASEALYALVPRATSVVERRALLRLRRAVFNGRPVPNTSTAFGSQNEAEARRLDEELLRYQRLLARMDELFTSNREAVPVELQAALSERVAAADFRVALAASSPTLFAALRRNGGLATSARDCRSLYAYVCRFAAKANPLHLFSVLVPASLDGVTAELRDGAQPCEVVFDVATLMSIERRILERSARSGRVRLALRTVVRKSGHWELWLKCDERLCIASLPDLPLLERLRALYERRRESGLPPSFTRVELEDLLVQEEHGEVRPVVQKAIDGLLARGVLSPYLIEDLSAPAETLRGVDSSSERLVDCLGRWHLARVKASALPELDRELADAAEGAHGDHVRYYVNSYADDDLREARRAAREIAPALTELKRVLAVESNFSPQQRVIRAFFREQLEENGTRRPFLDLLATFLRRRVDILDRYGWGRDAPEYEALVRRCREYGGQLDVGQLRDLAAGLRTCSDVSICFVGPFDFVERRFFLTNMLAGEQASVSRYLLVRRCETVSAHDDSPLDVELAVPEHHNLNHVVRRFDTGLAFDSRWAHGYKRWMQPDDVAVGLESGEPVYVHARTGRRLRFRYRGLLQSQYLPIEYQLLLVHHGDNYRSPFDDTISASTSEVSYRPALSFGPVCLRREAWRAPAAVVRDVLQGTESLRCAAALRRWVHQHMAPVDLWFYRAPRPESRSKKPRLLDLGSPLSVTAFGRALTGSETVVLSRMDPAPDTSWQVHGERYVAELMVEV